VVLAAESCSKFRTSHYSVSKDNAGPEEQLASVLASQSRICLRHAQCGPGFEKDVT
jgi:hypothetical protein